MMGSQSPIHGMDDVIPQCDEQNFYDDTDGRVLQMLENADELKSYIVDEPNYIVDEPNYADLMPPNGDPDSMDMHWVDNELFLSSLLADECAGYKYHTKHPMNWGNAEVNMWLQSYINDPEFCAEAFACLSGQDLCTMSRADFGLLDEKYGDCIYIVFQQLLRDNVFIPPEDYGIENRLPMPIKQENFADAAMISFDANDKFQSIPSFPMTDRNANCYRKLPSIDTFKQYYEPAVDSETPSEPPSPCSTTSSSDKSPKRKHTRAPKGNHLWEFVRDLLMDERYNPNLIQWEDREHGVFKFVKSDQVAKLWGEKKKNASMNYEKMSRAMRYYYKSNILESVDGRRLVYKFGSKATGWKTQI